MPEMDGLTAAKQILRDGQEQFPMIVAVTANTTEGIRETCLSAGMVDYITKPLDVETLVIVLERLSGIRD